MKKSIAVCVMAAATGATLPAADNAEEALRQRLPQIFARAAEHYKALDATATALSDGGKKIPHGWIAGESRLDMRPRHWWTAGHYPGSLWLLYEATGDEFFRERAKAWTAALASNSMMASNHDIGFIMYCSFGNARRIMGDESCDALLLEAADSLSKRFNARLGLIRSWGKIDDAKDFLVIPDNLMNLELLEWAAKAKGGERRFDEIARSHANVSMRHHYRPDGGCYHVLNYSQKDGRIKEIKRGQGAGCETAWARGQAWTIYGYTMMFRETGDRAYLDFAQKAADFAIDNRNMPPDGIPYWDFGAPGEERDSSAAAAMASGLLELSAFAGGEAGAKYRAFAVRQLTTLSSDEYFSSGDEAGHWLLKHGVGNKLGNSEIDVPLDYGDYYFLEALLRFRQTTAGGRSGASRVGIKAGLCFPQSKKGGAYRV